MPMIAMTTSNSTNVKPRRAFKRAQMLAFINEFSCRKSTSQAQASARVDR
jgi:hypothetical protein